MQPNGVVLVLCKQIDNYGDVGFCMRLCRVLQQSHHVILLHHCQEALTQLGFDAKPTIAHPHRIEAIDCSQGIPLSVLSHCVQAIVEPFGTSSLHAPPFFDAELKTKLPNTPWLVIDYLSAEAWVDCMHGHTITAPSTGHTASLYCPGFTHNTAGIIYQDAIDTTIEHALSSQTFAKKAYVFAYASAPIDALTNAFKPWGCTVHCAANSPLNHSNHMKAYESKFADCVMQAWVHQTDFDALLQTFDVLFVRGEDSFVRAQLAGKPFVWHIYPTADNAHQEKLQAFFNIYAEGLNPSAAQAIWALWCFWNGIPHEEAKNAKQCTANIAAHWPQWCAHAKHWREHLLQLPELGEGVLKWIAQH